MTDPTHTPDWNLLPHSPQAFFGLEEDFGRKDLKRSYNRLIRLFKPEKFPQEFQRIRGAYEQLDNQLRYGAQFSQSDSSGEDYAWVTDVSSEEAQNHESPSPQIETTDSQVPRRLPLHLRIQQEPLAEVYQNLSKKSEKTAYDYYALAVMSDLVHQKEGLQFTRWVLSGIKALPNEHGLYSLLYEYLRSPISSSTIPKLLIACSQVLAEDRFFAITESLWLRMLRESPFQDFRATLEKCETQLRGIGIDGRLAFSIEILKIAIWKADSGWIDKTMTLIDENFQRIPFHVQIDVDLLEMLRKYIDYRDDFIQGHPLRRKIDTAIQSYFSQDQPTGDLSILEAQIAIAQDSAALVEAFPYANEEDYDSLFTVWSVISEDVAERNVAPIDEEKDPGIWLTRVEALLHRTNTAANSSMLGFRWKLANLAYLGVLVAMYFFILTMFAFFLALMTISVNHHLVPLLILSVSFPVGGMAARWLHKKFLRPFWLRYCQKKSTFCYRNMWQQEILEFMDRSHLSYFNLRQLVFSSNITGLSYAEWVIGHFQQDYALAFYSTARRFVV